MLLLLLLLCGTITDPSERARSFRRLLGEDWPNLGRSGRCNSWPGVPSECIDRELDELEAEEGVGEGCESCEFEDIVDAIDDRVVA